MASSALVTRFIVDAGPCCRRLPISMAALSSTALARPTPRTSQRSSTLAWSSWLQPPNRLNTSRPSSSALLPWLPVLNRMANVRAFGVDARQDFLADSVAGLPADEVQCLHDGEPLQLFYTPTLCITEPSPRFGPHWIRCLLDEIRNSFLAFRYIHPLPLYCFRESRSHQHKVAPSPGHATAAIPAHRPRGQPLASCQPVNFSQHTSSSSGLRGRGRCG